MVARRRAVIRATNGAKVFNMSNETPATPAPEPQNLDAMAFVDSKGRRWSLAVSYLDVVRLQQETGHNLLDYETTHDLAAKIAVDGVFVCTVVHGLLRPKLVAAGVTDDDFADSLFAGDVLVDAQRALIEAIVFFTLAPQRVTRRGLLTTALKMVNQEIAKQEQMITGGKLEQMIAEELRSEEKKRSSLAPA